MGYFKDPMQENFEVAFEKLQGTVKKMESGELSLEDSLRQFEEGVRLTRICQEHLAVAEQRVDILMKSASGQNEGSPELQSFRNQRT